MFFKKNKVEVVPESEWTNFGSQHATRKDLAIAACVPAVASLGIVAWNSLKKVTDVATQSPALEVASYVDSTGGISRSIDSATYNPMPVGFTDKAGEVAGEVALSSFTTIMDPIIDILVALSLPVASIILVGSLFMMMLGQKEKSYSMMMNAGLSYVLIQMSPMLLNILKTAGNAVQPQ
ncbi:hypothetical protein [Rummeliibacillus stabekisii]|uniref:hypothetical protein n=1 Tax=Rummeliibacillus stabekisii TaxID=241244 RepID=UPI00371F6233